jgi:hypothetical protein
MFAAAGAFAPGTTRTLEVENVMETLELKLAQVERRIRAGERVVIRQREVVQRHVVAALPTEGPLGWLAEFEATLSELRSLREHLSELFAALATRRLIESFWSLPMELRCELATN